MAMIRNLSQLKKECAQLGLEVKQSGKRESKEDYVEALRNYNLKNVEMTFGLKYRLSMKSPQLCFLSNNLRQEELDEIYNSDNWVFEEKLNGIRMIVSYDPDYGFEFYSRNISVDNYLPVPYKEKIWLGSDSNFLHMFPSFVIDTEIISVNPNICTIMGKRGVVTETILQAVAATLALNPEDSIRIQKEADGPLKFYCFDCMYYDGVDLRKKSYRERRLYLKKVVEMLEISLPFKKVKVIRENKKDYLDYIWENGGEGVVAKRLDMEYLDYESRPRNGWVKIKRTVSGSLGDSVDAAITGYELADEEKGFKDLVGCLLVSIPLKRADGTVVWHLIAKLPNIEYELRKQITVVENGKPTLRKDMYGKVVEIEGQSISARALRFTHPRLIRFRDDKNVEQLQTYTEEELRKLIL